MIGPRRKPPPDAADGSNRAILDAALLEADRLIMKARNLLTAAAFDRTRLENAADPTTRDALAAIDGARIQMRRVFDATRTSD